MPLVFLHGVNTRDTDEGYHIAVAARRQLFRQLVVPTVKAHGHQDFDVRDDIYWGNLGVAFAWRLQAIPVAAQAERLGPVSDDASNPDLLRLMARSPATEPLSPARRVERLGAPAPGPLVAASRQDPGALVRAVFAREADRFAPTHPPFPDGKALPAGQVEKAEEQGTQLAFLLIAVDQLARDVQANPGLIAGDTDAQVVKKIRDEVEERYKRLVEPTLTVAERTGPEKLGHFTDAIDWTRGLIERTASAAKKLADDTIDALSGAKDQAERAGSLWLLEHFRRDLSSKGLRFLGDVFVYLQHGRTANPSISDRVKKGILDAAPHTGADGRREPFVVVTHSFGSEILYDLLTSGELDEVTIDLWVTVGAQTSLFAEMRLFAKSPTDIPSNTVKHLGKPKNVRKWINFYDLADVLSYLHAPVFGQEVVDIKVSEGANLTNAHGHYFVTPTFYDRIARELEEVL